LSNLDSSGTDYYNMLTGKYLENRICIVCSNKVKYETVFCNKQLNIEDFKTINN